MHRPRHTELVVDPHLAQWAVRLIVSVLGLLGVALGIAILIGGAERFSGISYRVALSLPGAPASWGFTVLVGGVLTILGTLLGRALVVSAGMLVAGFWCLLFSSAFFLAQRQYAQANGTAGWMYLSAALVCFIISGVYGATWRTNRTSTAT